MVVCFTSMISSLPLIVSIGCHSVSHHLAIITVYHTNLDLYSHHVQVFPCKTIFCLERKFSVGLFVAFPIPLFLLLRRGETPVTGNKIIGEHRDEPFSWRINDAAADDASCIASKTHAHGCQIMECEYKKSAWQPGGFYPSNVYLVSVLRGSIC